ncbi:hypothetical protein HELRODRAFT_178228 [Helobdella robusta]|uniref:Uncharacterized protein n=1 Tax=Helobdella robusta TaxID=6412 RepID=T1FCY9_HELRO|nr:hypothetical protein HELRODRAFT_178228 [Helobdella robusta]ESN97433.1 hypothetical protein HELRODRAFT_178228 [Helobdella robusta]
MAPTLQQCPVCFNHYRSTPDGKLCRHGGKVKGQKCSRDPLDLDYSGVFDKLTAVLKCVPVYDHIPKPCREMFAHDLNALLTAKTSRGGRRVNQGNLVNKRLSEYSTIGLETLVLCFDGFNNAKSQKQHPDRWINAVSSCIEQENLSSAVRLVCLPEGLAESSPATFDKLCSIHPKISAGLSRIGTNGCLPKLMYFLRTSKHIDLSKLGEFDKALRTALSSICNVQVTDTGRCLAWDVTVPGTHAERYVNRTSKECGLAAVRAADEKMKRYGNALPSMEFLPICIEVLGPMDPNTLKFLKAICKMISVRSGDSRKLFFATDHISCLLLRFLRVSTTCMNFGHNWQENFFHLFFTVTSNLLPIEKIGHAVKSGAILLSRHVLQRILNVVATWKVVSKKDSSTLRY